MGRIPFTFYKGYIIFLKHFLGKILQVEYITIFLCFLMLFNPVLKVTIERENPTAEDWNRHGVWIQQYIDGDITPLFTYPPLFHLFMIPFVLLLGNYIQLMQLVFLTFSFFSILAFTRHYEDLTATSLVATILGSSIIFTQYAPALMPQALDFILFPVCITLFFRKRYLLSASLLYFLTGTHIFGIFLFLIMFIYSYLVDKKFIKYLIVVFIAFIPILLTSYGHSFTTLDDPIQQIGGEYWIPFERGMFQVWTNDWDRYFTYPIQNFLVFSSPILWLLLPLTIYSMYKVKKFDKYQLLYTVWFFTLSPLIFFNIWRWFSYAIIPVTLFTASTISDYIRLFHDQGKEIRKTNTD